jgi:hypothetical protein
MIEEEGAGQPRPEDNSNQKGENMETPSIVNDVNIINTSDQQTLNLQYGERIENRMDTLGGRNYFFTPDLNRIGKETPNREHITTFIHKWLTTVTFNGKIYCYNRNSGVYSPDTGQINTVINEIARYCEREDLIPIIQLFVTKILLGKSVYLEYPFNKPSKIIPFLNTTLHLNKEQNGWDKRPVSSSDMVTWRIPHNYNENACVDTVINVLQEWTDKEDAQILIQICAHALYHQALSQPFKTAYLLVGESDSGKSTYITLIEKAFGSSMISNVPLQNIGKQFINASLEGKLFNAYDDLKSTAIKTSGEFKTHRGKFTHYIEHKGEMPYAGIIKCVYLFTSNPPLPRVEEVNDNAFFGSWKLIVFEHHFQRDPLWCERVFTDSFLSGFFCLILEEYIQIIKRGLQNEQSADDVRDLWLGTTDEKKFVDLELLRGPELEIDVDACYELYCNYKKNKNESAKNIVEFGKGIMYLGITKHRPRKGTEGKQKAVYRGIGSKTPTPSKDAPINKSLLIS